MKMQEYWQKIPREAQAALATAGEIVGLAFSAGAWIVMLAGFAHLVVAALHNRNGELGLGLDATMMGAGACATAMAVSAVSVPVWIFSRRELKRHREECRQSAVVPTPIPEPPATGTVATNTPVLAGK